MLDAGKQIIDATLAAAFPNPYVTLAVGGNGHTGTIGNLNPTADYVARNAAATARTSWLAGLIVQLNSLSTFIPVCRESSIRPGHRYGIVSPMSPGWVTNV